MLFTFVTFLSATSHSSGRSQRSSIEWEGGMSPRAGVDRQAPLRELISYSGQDGFPTVWRKHAGTKYTIVQNFVQLRQYGVKFIAVRAVYGRTRVVK